MNTLSSQPRSRLFLILVLTSLLFPATALGSSHREAPAITLDPTADNTDVYAFVSYEPAREQCITLIANFIPLQVPYGGPNFYKFDPHVLYEIMIDNDGDAVEDITYQFHFRTEVLESGTFLTATGPIESLQDPTHNVRQYCSIWRVNGPGRSSAPRELLGEDLILPPSNIGSATTPNYEALAEQAIHDLSDGSRFFAGQRDEGFYVDLAGIFDLLSLRTPGVDGTAGQNVHSIAIEVPMSRLTFDGSIPAGGDDPTAVIGVWSSASRATFSLLPSTGGTPIPLHLYGFETLTQVSRLGSPLVNEVVIPLAMKDRFNSSRPTGDAQFLSFVTDPELARLLNLLFGVEVPPTPRNDLVQVFLTGIPGLNQPPNVTPGEMLRLNMGITPTPADSQNRLGVVGGDLAGFPNGRRVGDDVLDVAVQAVAGILVDGTGAGLGDSVNQNDVPYLTSFPYLGTPHSGNP